MRYNYECQKEDCQFLFEVEQSLKAKRLKKCPACSRLSLERVILEAPLGFVQREPTTLGQQAERNSKKFGKEGVAARERKIKEEKIKARQESIAAIQKKLPSGAKIVDKQEHKPWYGKLPKEMKKHVAEGNTKKIEKYIMTGEK